MAKKLLLNRFKGEKEKKKGKEVKIE